MELVSVLTSLADANRISMTNTDCTVYSVEILLMMYSGLALSNKFEEKCIPLAFVIHILHDARSSECQTCVMCDRCIYNNRASRGANLHQCACPFCSTCAGFFGKASHHPALSALLQPTFGSLRLLAFPRAKIAVESEEICECDSHTVHRLSQRRLTAD